MVDCSGCGWKKELNSMSCKKNDENLGWINCDYICTPFQGNSFENNYLNSSFVNTYFCNLDDDETSNDETSCNTRNRDLKQKYNTNHDICIFNNDSCQIRSDIELSNLYTQTDIYSKTNEEIYDNNILNNGELQFISDPDNISNSGNIFNILNTLDNSIIENTTCTKENLINENRCDNLDITECQEKEGCIYDYDLNNNELSRCISRKLRLPNIDFNKYYNSLYSETNENSKFSILYHRYRELKDINNWPCITNDYPTNCSTTSSYTKMFIKSSYVPFGTENSVSIENIVSNEQLTIDINNLIELINDRCFSNTNENYCINIPTKADRINIEDYATIIRNNTISIFSELSAYTLDKIPYILLIEFNLFLENPDNRIEELFEQDRNIRDINNAQLYSDNLDFFIENLESNESLRNCFDDMLYTSPNDNELFDYILENPLAEWEDEHFEYITRKIDRFIEIGPHSINGCLRMIENINQNICRGEVTTGIISVITLITEVVGIQIDLNNIQENDQKLQDLIDIVIPRIPEIVKKIIDLSTYYEQNNCGTINTNTKVLIKFYENLLQPDIPNINYNLFNTQKIGSFFDDFINGNIYKKIILLVFIYLILSKISTIFIKKINN
ncbi:MAG: hypothetical protein CMI95_01150 [Pelagibacteraceae bacterium]|nr:hypothetical protein [Pelagibacteraceae bacterium]|tara:strand:- start:532 stop:2385 length:1854 start_codon:yes stop_codon:yes gene_type:complete